MEEGFCAVGDPREHRKPPPLRYLGAALPLKAVSATPKATPLDYLYNDAE